MKMKLILPILAAALLVGCRTTNDVIADYNANIAAGRYAQAAKEPAERAAEPDVDRLLWHLMSARASDLAGDAASAIAAYDAAEDVMDENGRRSVFAQGADTASAMLLNDKFFPYDGGGQDRIFTCLYKAVSYAAGGRPDAARTEFNRAATHQENWLYERNKDIAAAQENLDRAAAEHGGGTDEGQSSIVVEKAMSNASFAQTLKYALGFDLFTSGVLDKLKPADYQNPYVAHVTGVFRWMSGDGGRNYLKDAASLRPANSVAKSDFAACSAGTVPVDQVWVYVEDGLCPVREQKRIEFPLILIPGANRYVSNVGMALPRLLPRDAAADRWTAGGAAMEVIADVDALCKVEYDVYMRGAIMRELTRSALEVAGQVAAGIAAENARRHGSSNTATALNITRDVIALYGVAKRGADLRSWSSLPKKVYVARVPRPASGVVNVAANGLVAASVTVPQGSSMVFVRKPSVQAPCSVVVVPLK